MDKEPITLNGLNKLKDELVFLKENKRPKIVAAIAEARSHGDLKENAEYHAAKEEQSHNEGRINEINDIIARANVIDVTKINNNGKVIFGSTVFLENLDNGEKINYKIVGKDEADLKEKLTRDKLCLDLILMIFPELININIFAKLNTIKKDILKKKDFIFLLSLMIVDSTDNSDYFLYKFNISKKDQKRIKNIDSFYKEKINSKTFTENNMNRIFYYYGQETTLDILNHRIIKSKKIDNSLKNLIEHYESRKVPIMPVSADFLMKKYEIPEGKQLGEKLKIIEEEWVKNNFSISDQQVDNIINN